MSKKAVSNILLVITTLIWGSAFVAQKSGAALGNFTFNGIRTILGGIVLIQVILVMNKGVLIDRNKKEENKITLIGGLCCGVVLFIASSLQQFGVSMTSVGKAGFITVMYVAFVPIIGIFLRKKTMPRTWLCVVIACIGFYFLCLYGETLTLETGDLLVLLCALGFSGHILVIDHFSPKCDGVKMSCIQFFTAGILALIAMLIFETPIDISNIMSGWVTVVYAGVLSSGVGYTLQIVAQKNAEPTQASLIMCLESVFALIAGAIFLDERMTGVQYIGCAIIFAASIISNLPDKRNKLETK